MSDNLGYCEFKFSANTVTALLPVDLGVLTYHTHTPHIAHPHNSHTTPTLLTYCTTPTLLTYCITPTQRGFTPAHCSAYDNHLPCLRVVLDFIPPANAKWSKLNPDTLSQHQETLLHTACLRGNLELAQFLVKREADVTAVDRLGNTVPPLCGEL